MTDPPFTPSPSVSVVVFAFNEAENIAPVLTELTDWTSLHEPNAEVVVVDDGSTDETLSVARQALQGVCFQTVRHEKNLGIGAALKSGVRVAKGDWVTFLPADGQVPPAAIGALRTTATQGLCDVVFSVYRNRDDGLHRKVLSWGVRTLIQLVHGVRLQSDGPYLFRRSLFLPEQLASDSFFLNFEFPIRALQAGLRVGTTVIDCRPRRAGQSKTANARRVRMVAQELIAMRLRRFRP